VAHKHSLATMDAMIESTAQHRQALIKAGHIDHFGQRVQQQTAGAAGPAPTPVTHDGYCMKCKTRRTVNTEGVLPTKNKAHRAHGKCPVCGTGVHTFKSAADGKQMADALQSNLAFTNTGT
jgi:hypothetical protein